MAAQHAIVEQILAHERLAPQNHERVDVIERRGAEREAFGGEEHEKRQKAEGKRQK
jgi:hypothetical protein